MRNLKKKGFTIVELVIVIAVIAVLAAVLIPTFINLTKKANISADEQAVAQMNKILKIEEASGNKPTSAMEVLNILTANGYNKSLDPYYSEYTLAWLSETNSVVLVKNNAVVYPKDCIGKEGFSLFIAVENNPAELQNAINNLADGEVLVITEDIAALDTLTFDFTNEGSYGLNFNGNKITSKYAILEDSALGGYFKNVSTISAGNVVFANGTIEADGDATTICLTVTKDASVTLNNMLLDNTKVNTGKTCLLSNYNTETLTINNSEITASGNAIQACESNIVLNNVIATSENERTDLDYMNSAIGLCIDTNKGATASVTVNDGTYTGKYFVSIFGGLEGTYKLIVNGGTFTGAIYDTGNKINLTINGGTFNTTDEASIQKIKNAVQPGCSITINGESYSK